MTMTAIDVDVLAASAQRNCDLADAHHAQGMSLCAYLLDLREYYRWQQGLALDAVPVRPELSAWIARREALWDELRDAADADYLSVRPDATADPFDESGVNAELAAHGLVYGAGIGRFGRPLFVLAERAWVERRDGIDIVVAGRELARGLTAPPAVSRDGRALIRLDAMERWLWTKLEEWRHHPHDSGFAAAWAIHAGDGGDAVAGIKRMALAEVETLVLHEIGEQRLGRRFGEDAEDAWDDMLGQASRKSELLARALRDLLADCTTTLPTLLERGAAASIHFWFGNLDGTRRVLAPGLEDAYRRWCRGDSGGLPEAVAAGREHWETACADLLTRWRAGGNAAIEALANTPDGYIRRAGETL